METETIITSEQSGSLSYTKSQTDLLVNKVEDKVKEVNYTLLGVVIILLAMFMTVLIDAFHFNSAVYSEYSQKTKSLEAIQKTNEVLLKQVLDLSEQSKQDRLIIKSLLIK